MGGNSLIDRLFKRESTTKEEIRQLVDEDQAKGELEASQREMIHNIFDFDRLCAEDIMTHRTEIEAVEETATIGYAAAFALEAGCSRIPVFHEDLDNVQGILYVKDLLPFVGKPVPAGTRLTDCAGAAVCTGEYSLRQAVRHHDGQAYPDGHCGR